MSSEDEKQRMIEIMSCCENSPVNIEKLKELSRKPNGFLNNKIRSKIWPKLLGINRYDMEDYKKLIKPHRDERQVRVDIDRSFWSLDCAKHWGEKRLNRKRADLSNIIIALLSNNPGYYYFQGLHDVISVFLLVFNDNSMAFTASELVCQGYLADFMRRDFSSLSKMMKLIMTLIQFADEELFKFLESSGTEPFFATSWLITWMSHDIRSLDQIGRMFDVLLCSPPEYCFYLCASLVLLHREEVLELECDFSTVHNKLSRLLKKNHTPFSNGSNTHSFKCDIDLEALIKRADQLIKDLPPNELLSLADSQIAHVIEEHNLLLFHTPSSLDQFLPNSVFFSLISDNDLLRDSHLQHLSLSSSSLNHSQSIKSSNKNPHLIVLFTGWITFLRSESVGLLHQSTINISTSFLKEMLKRIWRGVIFPLTIACGIDKKQSRTLIAMALLGGVMSFGTWMYQSKYPVTMDAAE